MSGPLFGVLQTLGRQADTSGPLETLVKEFFSELDHSQWSQLIKRFDLNISTLESLAYATVKEILTIDGMKAKSAKALILKAKKMLSIQSEREG